MTQTVDSAGVERGCATGAPTLDAAKASLTAAFKHQTSVRFERQTALVEVADAFSDRIRDADMAVSAAKMAVTAAESAAAPDHPWENKIVRRVEIEMHRFSDREKSRTELRGMVKTYRPGLKVSGRYEVTHAPIGTPLVLLLRRDGQPGLRAERLDAYHWRGAQEQKWHLPDDSANPGSTS